MNTSQKKLPFKHLNGATQTYLMTTVTTGGCYNSGFSRDSIKSTINAIPPFDVAPVVKGRWVSKNTHGYDWVFVCSNCGYVDGYPFNDRHNFCPNCGAKMRQEDL